MNIQTNLNKIISLSLVSLTATSLSFATVTPAKVAFAQSGGRSVSPDTINTGMNGTWNLDWKVNGWLHRGRLTINGNFGTIIVNATPPNGQTVHAKQEISIVPDQNGYTLQGSTPTYPGSNQINPKYQPDTFYVKSDGNGGWRMENCSNYHGCIRVNMTKLPW
ncbi:hypothetical protein [Okeania sp. SIO1I7]|uniref:hypothetical protein n=1 Tax=Okeania sp. SIO1I7 TaxID=2607772 RepID=UPI0013F76A7D|nr:hypothetical protein [Okeania sp. SIO1I7]NET26206.1 hypothetical protein [Okeania sp. SIO1I7]